MTKKTLILIIFVLILAVFLFGCNDTTPDFTDYGFSIGGKIIINDLPSGVLLNVSILVNDVEVGSADENGMFYVSKLTKGDVVSFYMKNVVFYPENHRVTGNLNDLRVSGYYQKEEDSGNNGNGTPDSGNEDGNQGGNAGDNGNDNNGNDNGDDGNNNNNIGNNDSTDKNVYNCTNAGLLFENNRIKFVLCANKDFSRLDVSYTVNDVSNTIDVDETMIVGDVTIDGETFVQYSVDVTTYATGKCVFSAVAYNSTNVSGSVASASFAPVGVCTPTQISIDNGILTIYNFDDSAVHFLTVNGVAICPIDSNTVDLSSIFAYDNSEVSIAVITYKAGYTPAISNIITTTLNIKDI